MTDANPEFVELLEQYEAWKKRSGNPDYSPAAFMDYYCTQGVLEAVQEIWGDNGQSMWDSSELNELLPTPVKAWLNVRYNEAKAEIE